MRISRWMIALAALAALSGCTADQPELVASVTGVVEVVASSNEGLPSEDIETVTLDPGDDLEVELTLDTGIR